MSLVAGLIAWGERTPVPDVLTRAMIAWLVGRTDRSLAAQGAADDKAFAAGMDAFPVAIHTDAANAQHYEVPAAFFLRTLGPKRKYSCCFYDGPATSLAEAEVKALDLTMDHAGLADGQRILELGCGWGSLSLTMAARYPGATITAVSNSHSQRAFIEGEATRLGLTNLTIVTSDMNDFAPEGQFDRIVSVEMFEHMANWRALLTRVRSWLKADGRLFIHVFTHRTGSYRFDAADKTDWIAQHFFTGGLMPGHGLIRQFPDLFTVEDEWRWSGEHYRRTAEDWLALFDARLAEIDPILTQVYGAENLALWRRRWRLFFLATSGLFGYAGGDSWGVSHYRLKPAA